MSLPPSNVSGLKIHEPCLHAVCPKICVRWQATLEKRYSLRIKKKERREKKIIIKKPFEKPCALPADFVVRDNEYNIQPMLRCHENPCRILYN